MEVSSEAEAEEGTPYGCIIYVSLKVLTDAANDAIDFYPLLPSPLERTYSPNRSKILSNVIQVIDIGSIRNIITISYW